jgi:hypothetical protein
VHVDYVAIDQLDPSMIDESLMSSMLDVNRVCLRIASGRILDDPDGRVSALVDRFRSWRLSPLLHAKLIGEALSLLSDAVGCYESGRLDVAEIALRMCGHSLAKLVLLARGNHYVALKWQPLMLERDAPDWLERVRTVLGLTPDSLAHRLRVAAAATNELRGLVVQ